MTDDMATAAYYDAAVAAGAPAKTAANWVLGDLTAHCKVKAAAACCGAEGWCMVLLHAWREVHMQGSIIRLLICCLQILGPVRQHRKGLLLEVMMPSPCM